MRYYSILGAAALAFVSTVTAQVAGFNAITSPTQDQQIVAGENFDVIWQPGGAPDDATVTIKLLQGKTPSTLEIGPTVASNIPSKSGKFTWKVPENLEQHETYGFSMILDGNDQIFQYSFPFHIIKKSGYKVDGNDENEKVDGPKKEGNQGQQSDPAANDDDEEEDDNEDEDDEVEKLDAEIKPEVNIDNNQDGEKADIGDNTQAELINKPAENMQAEQAIKPAENMQAEQAIKPAENMQAEQAIKPAENMQAEQAIKPAENMQAEQAIKPAENMQAEQSIQPADNMQAEQAIKPADINEETDVKTEVNIESENKEEDANAQKLGGPAEDEDDDDEDDDDDDDDDEDDEDDEDSSAPIADQPVTKTPSKASLNGYQFTNNTGGSPYIINPSASAPPAAVITSTGVISQPGSKTSVPNPYAQGSASSILLSGTILTTCFGLALVIVF